MVRLARGRRVLVASLVFVLCLLAVVTVLNFLRQRASSARLQSTLIEAAQRVRSNGTTEQVDLATAANFEWDRLYVIAPYTPMETVRGLVGASVPVRRLHRIDSRDDVVLLLFFRGKELVEDLPFPRAHADLLPLVRPSPYKRGGAAIEFARRGEGAPPEEIIARPLGGEQ